MSHMTNDISLISGSLAIVHLGTFHSLPKVTVSARWWPNARVDLIIRVQCCLTELANAK